MPPHLPSTVLTRLVGVLDPTKRLIVSASAKSDLFLFTAATSRLWPFASSQLFIALIGCGDGGHGQGTGVAAASGLPLGTLCVTVGDIEACIDDIDSERAEIDGNVSFTVGGPFPSSNDLGYPTGYMRLTASTPDGATLPRDASDADLDDPYLIATCEYQEVQSYDNGSGGGYTYCEDAVTKKLDCVESVTDLVVNIEEITADETAATFSATYTPDCCRNSSECSENDGYPAATSDPAGPFAVTGQIHVAF